MTEPCDVLVAIPAHDEADRIEACLRSVAAALRAGQAVGLVQRGRIAVGAHRCRDETAAIATGTLRDLGWSDHVVLDMAGAAPVGLVRTRLACRARQVEPALPASRLWLFSTDADSVVPADWVSGMLRAAAEDAAGDEVRDAAGDEVRDAVVDEVRDAAGDEVRDAAGESAEGEADVVAGLVDLAGWRGGRAARRAYRQIIASKLLPGGGHDHAYAANLAVRWTTFEAIGGFPGVAHGEEAALLVAARDAGARVATPRTPRVRTSGRMPGRAPEGLGDLLGRLGKAV